MLTDEQALKAAKALRRYCKEHARTDCKGCQFRFNYYCRIDAPCCWYFKGEELDMHSNGGDY